MPSVIQKIKAWPFTPLFIFTLVVIAITLILNLIAYRKNHPSAPPPSPTPTLAPSPVPTPKPTETPVLTPTKSPTKKPTPKPTTTPTFAPTSSPTNTPGPTATPTPDTSPPTLVQMTGPENGGTYTYTNFCFPLIYSDNVTPNAGIQINSKFDSQDWSGWNNNYSPCYSNVAPGEHTFSVKAKDAAGNESPTTSRTFTLATPTPSPT